MKIRFLSLLLATIMVMLTFTSCSKKAEPADTSTSTIETVSTNETESTTTTTTTTQSTTEKEKTKPTTTKETSPSRKPTTQKKTNVSTTKGAKSITVSKSNIKLKVGESVKINITAKNSYEVIYYSTESKSVTCKWGTWKGDTTSLTITGRRGGTAKIVFYFESNPNKIMATVNVTVDDDNTTTKKTTTTKPTTQSTATKPITESIIVDKSSINLQIGETATVIVTYTGYNHSIVSENSDPDIISCKWGEWNGKSIPLKITALQEGISTIIFYYEDNPNKVYARVNVTVGHFSGNKDIKDKVGSPTSHTLGNVNTLGGYSFYIDSADGIKVLWAAKNLSNKTVNYYTLTFYFYNRVGDPAYSEITGKSSYTQTWVGPIGPNEDFVCYDIIDYVPACHKIVIGEIKLQYSDGSTDSGWYGYSTTKQNNNLSR